MHPHTPMHHVRAPAPAVVTAPRCTLPLQPPLYARCTPAAPPAAPALHPPLHPPLHTRAATRHIPLLQGLGNLQLRGSWMARERGKVHVTLESASGLPSPDGQTGPVAP
jgi:hypothetical protein